MSYFVFLVSTFFQINNYFLPLKKRTTFLTNKKVINNSSLMGRGMKGGRVSEPLKNQTICFNY